jgi:hypothetical protein
MTTTATTTDQSWKIKLLWAVLGLHALLVIMGIGFHEPWRDEAQAWLLVRDLNFGELFPALRGEGHPPLWYLLIFPLVKLGLPYAAQNWLAGIIVLAGLYILLLKTNLNFWLKLLLPFGHYMLYEYPVFARSYCLAVFFIAALIYLYPRRFDKPWLFALCVIGLFNTHMLMFTFCASVVGIYIIDAVQGRQDMKKLGGAIALMCIGGLYLIPYLVMAKDTNVYEAEVADHVWQFQHTVGFGVLAQNSFMLAMVLLLAMLVGLSARTKPLLILLGGAVGLFYVLVYKFMGFERHCGLLFLMLLFAYGIAKHYAADSWNFIKQSSGDKQMLYGQYVLALCIAGQIAAGMPKYLRDKNEPFSDSKNVAEFILENNYQDLTFYGHWAMYACTVLPYMPDNKQMYMPECQRFGSYYIYDTCAFNRNWNKPADYHLNIAYNHMQGRLDKALLILNHPLEQALVDKYRLDLLYYTPAPAITEYEMFCVYRGKPLVASPQ